MRPLKLDSNEELKAELRCELMEIACVSGVSDPEALRKMAWSTSRTWSSSRKLPRTTDKLSDKPLANGRACAFSHHVLCIGTAPRGLARSTSSPLVPLSIADAMCLPTASLAAFTGSDAWRRSRSRAPRRVSHHLPSWLTAPRASIRPTRKGLPCLRCFSHIPARAVLPPESLCAHCFASFSTPNQNGCCHIKSD